MVKKTAIKKQKEQEVETPKKGPSFFDYLRFGESYTSLVLGVIVVIIATALLLSFVHNKEARNVNAPISQQTQNTVKISQERNNLAKKAPNTPQENAVTDTPVPTKVIPTVVPTVKPKVSPVKKPTITPEPTAKPTARPTEMAKRVMKLKPTNTPQVLTGKDNNIWVVQKGESLWMIAEKKYTSGYNWVDIARANNLADPSNIHVGDRLILPKVTPGPSTIIVEKPTVTTNDQQFSSTKRVKNEITGKMYTVVKGDTLWDIAVRAYGNGYRWPDIEKANNLANPGLIFSGNKLILPRP